MKKSIKAIIAAISASIMCAAPITTYVANVNPTKGITAEAASDIIHDVAFLNNNGGLNVIGAGALTYHIVGNNAILYGRYNPVDSVNMPDKIRYNNKLYPVTEVAPRAFKNAVKTACGEGVYTFRSGKNVKKIGDEAFYGSSLQKITLTYGLEEIGNRAFAYTNVGSMLNIPGTVKKVNAQAFKGCDYVEYLFFNGSSATPLDISSEAFRGLSKLKTIYVSRGNFKANGKYAKDNSIFKDTPSSFDVEYDIDGDYDNVEEFTNRYF